jgi:polar amino acid transport system substrate-binding protein
MVQYNNSPIGQAEKGDLVMPKIVCLKNITLFILLVLFLAQGNVPSWASDVELSKDSTLEGILKRGELRIGLEAGYMPFEMIDKRSGLRQRTINHGGLRKQGRKLRLIGFDIDIGIEMAKTLGVKPVFVDTFWPSIIPALNLGRFDIIFGGMSVTERRKKQVDFSNPIMIVGQTILLNARHKDSVQSYKDLNNSKFIVVSKPGTTGEEAVQQFISNATYEAAGSEIEGAMRVLSGKEDAFVYDFPFNAVFSAMNPSSKLVFLNKPFTKEPVAWAIRKNDPDFMKFLNNFLLKIRNDGRFDKIYKKWFKSTNWYQFVR